jgi:uncharacterized protein (DUF1697 family)
MAGTKKEAEATEGQTRYAAFLRGINVGGHRLIKMDELARIFGDMGLSDVRTVIASGNVLFASDETDEARLTTHIEQSLEKALGYPVDVMLRTIEWLRELEQLDPFHGFEKEDGHRYVAFMQRAPGAVPELPAHFPDEYFSVLAVQEREVFHVTRKMPNGRHGDPGKYIAKNFGKVSTVRNWNTVVKIAAM